MNETHIWIKEWIDEGDRIKMVYQDGSVIYVKRARFNQSFGALIQADKSAMVHDFSADPDFEIL